jgi:hypothetical protein
MSISTVLIEKYSGYEWSIVEDDYSTFVWNSNTPKPTLEELEALIDESNTSVAFRLLRNERNKKLAASDWTQAADAPVDKEAWAAYRQALRDLPEYTVDPENPVWPTPPE